MAEQVYVLEASKIRKTFPGVVALSDFDFQLARGEIHGLLGENGAGKTTFIKLVNGLYPPDSGDIRINGERVERLSPILSSQKGIKFIHQDLSVFPFMSIVDNIRANNYPRNRLGWIDWKKATSATREVLRAYDLELDPRARMRDLSIGQMQLIEIIANVSQNARVIVMDEPTASLGDTEKQKLFSTMRVLKERQISIIFISHILEEVLAICDRITVMRDGRKIGTYVNQGLDKEFVIGKIVGEKYHGPAAAHGVQGKDQTPLRPALQARDIRFRQVLRGVSFTLGYGEVVGILGLLGAGKTELANICFGWMKPSRGSLMIDGAPAGRLSPHAAIRKGIGYVTEDRHKSGIFRGLSIATNCSILILRALRTFLSIIDRKRERTIVAQTAGTLSIKMSSLDQEIRLLSGGNQQKALLARWLIGNQKILLFDEPTKGVDVGARGEFYQILHDLKGQGKAILVLTSDHQEALAVCERVLLLKGGTLRPYDMSRGADPRDLLNKLVEVEENA
jgi:ribose transport system ATP-binding protein